MAMIPKDEGQLWVKGQLVSLIIPKIIEFYDKPPVEAIRLVRQCVGLSQYDRDHLTKAIYLHTDKKSTFM